MSSPATVREILRASIARCRAALPAVSVVVLAFYVIPGLVFYATMEEGTFDEEGNTTVSALVSWLGANFLMVGIPEALGAVTLFRMMMSVEGPAVSQAVRFILARAGTLALLSVFVDTLVVAGVVALFVPGVYIGTGLFLLTPVFAIETQSAPRALERSWSMMRGNRLRAFWLGMICLGPALVGPSLLSLFIGESMVLNYTTSILLSVVTAFLDVTALCLYLDLAGHAEAVDVLEHDLAEPVPAR